MKTEGRKNKFEDYIDGRLNGGKRVFVTDEIIFSFSFCLVRTIAIKLQGGRLSSADAVPILSMLSHGGANGNGVLEKEQMIFAQGVRCKAVCNAIFHARRNTWDVYGAKATAKPSSNGKNVELLTDKPQWLMDDAEDGKPYLVEDALNVGCRRCDKAEEGDSK